MKTIDAAKFEAQCLAPLDDTGPDGLVITNRGQPIARLRPIERPHAELIGGLRDQLEFRDDLVSTGVRWDTVAELRHPRP